MFKQDFSDFYKVYSAVHDSKLREEVKSQRDEISEMDLSLFSDKDLIEIAEEVVQELFEKGYKIEDVSVVLSDDTSSSFRKEKLRRINEALDSVVEEVTNNAATTAIESFKLYRAHKKLQERRIEQRGIEEGRIKSAQALNIYTVEKATIKKGLKSILESIKEAATPESGTGKYYREGKPTQQQLDNRAKREKIKQLTNQGKHKEASALHNEHNEEEVVDEAMSSYDKARKAAARRAADRNAARKRGELGGRMERETYTNEAGTRMHHKGYKANANEEVVKEKESYDTVAAVIDYDRSKKGSKDATYDSDHGKKKAAKKERDYAAWEREKMKRDDPNWKHKKYHTGMHGEDKDWGYDKEGNSLNPDDIEAKERKAAKGQVKKELKDVEKAAETLKGKNIAKADKVEEGQSWITSGKFSQEEIDSILEKEEISLGKSQELSEDWLDASIEVAAEYFFSEGINEDGLEQIIEEVGLENFVEFVTDPIDELSEERSARKASVRAPSYEKVKAKVDATDAAKKKAKKGEYASSYAKKETDVTVYDDKPTAKKKAAPAKKPVAKKAPAKKKVVVKKVAPAKKVENQKKVVKSVATTKTKQQPKPASKKGLVGKIRSAVEKGVERHKAARAKGREPEKRVKEFGKGFASGVKSAVKFAGDVKKVVSKEDYETKKKGEVLSAFKRDPKVRKRFEKAAKKDRGPGSVENQAADDMLQTAKDIAKRKGDTSKSDDRYAYESVVGEAKKSKENPKGRHPRDQAELDRAQEYIKKNPNFGKVSEGVTATLNGKSYKLLPDKTREKLKKHGKGGLDGDYRTEVGKVKDAVTDKLGLTNTKRDGVKCPKGHQDCGEAFEIDKSAHKTAQKKAKLRNLAKGNTNPNEKAAAEKKAGGPKLIGEGKKWDSYKKAVATVLGKKKEKKAEKATDAGARAKRKLQRKVHATYVSGSEDNVPDDMRD